MDTLTSKTLNYHGKLNWPKLPSTQQQFPLPDSIIYYITKNPLSPKAYLKLVKSCKYFFEKHPLLIVNRIRESGSQICSKNCMECLAKRQRCCVSINLEKISSKIWLTDWLYLNDTQNYDVAILHQKLYKCENAVFVLRQVETNLEKFVLIASLFEKIDLSVQLTHSDGSIVMLDEILASLPNVKEFEYLFDYDGIPAVTTSTMKNIFKFKNLANLCKFQLCNIPEVIDVSDLARLIKNQKDTKFLFHFHPMISQGYKNQLDQLVDFVIASNISNRFIMYKGHDEEKYNIMESRFTY